MTHISISNVFLKDHVLLWEEFCPQFPWVGPLGYSTEDGEIEPTTVSIRSTS